MAKLTFHVGLDMDDLASADLPYLIEYGDVTSQSSTRYSVTYRESGYSETVTFTGTGFGSYANKVPTTGQVTGFTWQVDGYTIFTMSAVSISVQELTGYVLNYDNLGLFERIYSGADTITGSADSDHIYGYAGDDLMNGGGSEDLMEGGAGNDTYVVNNAFDVVREYWGEGIDKILSSVTYQLDNEVENLTLTGTGRINGTGNDAANLIVGNVNANRLDGLEGADTLKGAGGDDVYLVDVLGDKVVEAAAGGRDRVETELGYLLAANVEDLTLLGLGHVNGNGNALDNRIVGNAGNNIINGRTGADYMAGAAGSDTYIADNVGDKVVEASLGGGIDAVRSSVTFTLGLYLENLTLTGTAVANGTGNSLANVIIGNGVNNSLEGLAGNDRLEGAAGDDRVSGGAGSDLLKGGAGVDKFLFGSTVLGAGNVDTILDFSSGEDRILLDRDVFAAFLQDGRIAQSAFHVGTGAHDADDRIIYNQATGNLYYDHDGLGGAAQVLFAKVGAGSELTNLDVYTYTG